MLFHTIEFAVFLAIVYGLYRLLPFRAQNYMLLAASYVFYGWWDYRFLFLMILSTTIDYWTGLVTDRGKITRRQALMPAAFLSGAAIILLGTDVPQLGMALIGQTSLSGAVLDQMTTVLWAMPLALAAIGTIYWTIAKLPDQRRRKSGVVLSLVVQLGILATFKYFNFFVDSFVSAVGSLGYEGEIRYIDIVLPVGISFYTFQSLSYVIDIYRGELKATRRYFDYALFVAFFPQLVAGPIERAKRLLPQIMHNRELSLEQTTRGLFLITLGLFKKIAIADGVAPFVDQTFSSSGTVSWGDVTVGTVLFAIQIYCDFSGYSDIARGTAKLFGVELMRNFNQPYFARSPREFWQRWHISLSTWLSDYLYKSLGGNRGTLAFTCRNLMLTMILGGLWHGAAWNFVLWGLYHGTALSIHRIIIHRRGKTEYGPRIGVADIAKMAGFGLFTLYGWLLFRAGSSDQVVDFTRILATGSGGLSLGAQLPNLAALCGILLLVGMELRQYAAKGDPMFYRRFPLPLTGAMIAAMIFLTAMGMSNAPAQFIYFQF